MKFKIFEVYYVYNESTLRMESRFLDYKVGVNEMVFESILGAEQFLIENKEHLKGKEFVVLPHFNFVEDERKESTL